MAHMPSTTPSPRVQKEVLCYCWLDTKIEDKEGGCIRHNGGRGITIVLTEQTSRIELLTMLESSFGIDLSDKVIMYSLKFNRMDLVELLDDMAMGNLLQYNDDVGYLYVFSSKEQAQCDVEPSRRAVSVEQNAMLGREFSGEVVASNLMFDPVPTPHTLQMAVQCVNPPGSTTCAAFLQHSLIGPGQTFSSPNAFREALHLYSIATKFKYKFKRNFPEHISAQCVVDNCPWKLTGNSVGKTSFMTVCTFEDKHVHSVQDMVQFQPKMHARYISVLVENLLREQPNISPIDICTYMQVNHGLDLTYMQAWRCKEVAEQKINGSPNESYMLLPWLCERIKSADKKSVTFLTYEPHGHNFQQLFVAYGCSINGFLTGCRPIIFIDGCHLRGPYQGTILSAVSMDANDHLYPLAYAVVSAESFENWLWFLNILKAYVTKDVEVVIISDRNPSISAGLAQSYGRQRHAFCYRHIKENYSTQANKVGKCTKKVKERALQLLDAVAYARLEVDYNAALDAMRTFCPALAYWVETNEPERWVMSKFQHKRWDCITTNSAESFNNWINDFRNLPIYSFVNHHRELLATKLYSIRRNLDSWKTMVGPNIEIKLKENLGRGECAYRSILPYGHMAYRVSMGNVDLRVDLHKRECTCQAWQMSGLPCPHACVAIKNCGGNIYEYVDSYYHKSRQQAIYARLLTPVETHDPTPHHVAPPLTRRPIGRPQKTRIESQFITKRPVHCSRCNICGHNRRKCTNPNPTLHPSTMNPH